MKRDFKALFAAHLAHTCSELNCFTRSITIPSNNPKPNVLLLWNYFLEISFNIQKIGQTRWPLECGDISERTFHKQWNKINYQSTRKWCTGFHSLPRRFIRNSIDIRYPRKTMCWLCLYDIRWFQLAIQKRTNDLNIYNLSEVFRAVLVYPKIYS